MMLGLSIKQPWAWAIANGHKTIETRRWPTRYRGDVLIVSSLGPDRNMMDYLREIEVKTGRMDYGKAIAVARLAGCRRMVNSDEEQAMCAVYDGAYSWILEAVRKIAVPFGVKGQLGLYKLSDEILMKAMAV